MPVEPAEDALLGVLFQGHILSSPRLALATLSPAGDTRNRDAAFSPMGLDFLRGVVQFGTLRTHRFFAQPQVLS